jgi:tetratricopeptide (TPR) repeat protein
MRIYLAATVIGAAFLASCAGHPPATKVSRPQPLASWNGGSIDQSGWDSWKKNGNIPTNPNDELAGFNDLVRVSLDAHAAADNGITSDPSKARRWASIVDRILSDVLRRDFISLQAGFTDSAILKWASSQDPATRKLPMDSLRAKGGKALLLAGINLDSVYDANKGQFTHENSVPVVPGWDSAKIAQILSKQPVGKVALGARDSITVDSLRKLGAAPYKKITVQIPLDSVRARVQEIASATRLDRLGREYLPKLRESYGVKLVSIAPPAAPDDSLQTFWKANPTRWWNEPTYRLSALSSKDSASLAKAVAKTKDLASFRKLSSRFPVGTPAAPNGEIGRVKEQMSVPYGIGMVPVLFSKLDSTKAGHLVAPFRANDSLFLSVWLEERDSGSIKPFASVRAAVQGAFRQAHPYVAPSSSVLATWDKGSLFTKSDVDFISEEIPTHAKRSFPPERVLDFMVNWAVAGRAARENGVFDRPSTKLILSENENNYWAQEFRGSDAAQTFLFPKSAADSATTAWAKVLGKAWSIDSGKGINHDGARLLLLEPKEIERSYQTKLDMFRKDSNFLPIDSVRGEVFNELRTTLDGRGRDRIDSVLKARYHYQQSPAAPHANTTLSPKAILDSARTKHDSRSQADAERLYRQVESNATAPDSLRAQALFQLGQLYGEQTNYLRSLEAYRTVLARYPKSSEAYKAQFMIAFTYSEYLKIDKIAVGEYQKVKDNYPKCDLFNDADWMIRNIKSGGALMPKFDDSAFVADSAARVDSLKKLGLKDTTRSASTSTSAVKSSDSVGKTKADSAKTASTKSAVAPKVAPNGATKKVVVPAKVDTTAKAAHPARDTAAATR